MNLRPPVPTSDKLPQDEAKSQHRAALIPVAIGLIIVLGLAGYSALTPKAQIVILPYITEDLSSPGMIDHHEPYASGYDGGNLNFQPPANVDDVILLRADESTLVTEPAELPPPVRGRRIAGFVRSQNYLEDEYAFWEIPDTNVQAVTAYYQQAAETLNFKIVSNRQMKLAPAPASSQNTAAENKTEPVKKQTDQQAQAQPLSDEAPDEVPVSRTLIFMRQLRPQMNENKALPPANDVLVVRAKTLPEGRVHLTLWYRYASRINR